MHMIKLSEHRGINLAQVVTWDDTPNGPRRAVCVTFAASSEDSHRKHTIHSVALEGEERDAFLRQIAAQTEDELPNDANTFALHAMAAHHHVSALATWRRLYDAPCLPEERERYGALFDELTRMLAALTGAAHTAA